MSRKKRKKQKRNTLVSLVFFDFNPLAVSSADEKWTFWIELEPRRHPHATPFLLHYLSCEPVLSSLHTCSHKAGCIIQQHLLCVWTGLVEGNRNKAICLKQNFQDALKQRPGNRYKNVTVKLSLCNFFFLSALRRNRMERRGRNRGRFSLATLSFHITQSWMLWDGYVCYYIFKCKYITQRPDIFSSMSSITFWIGISSSHSFVRKMSGGCSLVTVCHD